MRLARLRHHHGKAPALGLVLLTARWRLTHGVCSGIAAAPIGIGDGKPAQNLALEAFHCGGVFLALVIVTQQMQEAMHGEVRQMVRKRFAFLARFRGDSFMSEHNIADERSLAPDGSSRE
jgi:hypothetical protein